MGRTSEARELAAALAECLPVNLRWQFQAATSFSDDQPPGEWAHYVLALLHMVLDPNQIITELDGQPVRRL